MKKILISLLAIAVLGFGAAFANGFSVTGNYIGGESFNGGVEAEFTTAPDQTLTLGATADTHLLSVYVGGKQYYGGTDTYNVFSSVRFGVGNHWNDLISAPDVYGSEFSLGILGNNGWFGEAGASLQTPDFHNYYVVPVITVGYGVRW